MKKKVSKPKAVKKRSFDAALVNDDSVSVAEMVEGKRSRPSKKAVAKAEKKLSALDAAYQVLKARKSPMTCPELIEAMAKQGLWSSPKGKTPHATLYAAILREISTKGKAGRFKKTERGKFMAV